VPSTAVSGVYIALLQQSNGDKSQIPFVVRDDASHSAVLFQTSDSTWQAYNTYGGSSFYTGGANGRAFKLSYNRPFATRALSGGRDYLFSNEFPMIRFLERNGYDVSYTTDVDSDRRGALIRNHKVFLSVGHDEYWSQAQRSNVEAARDAGVNLAFFTGNEVYWRTRWETSVDGSGTPYRTLVCYKETWAGTDTLDPTSEWTGTFRDPRFTPPTVGGANPENALTGTMFMSNHTDLTITVPEPQGKLRLWRNTSVATLAAGQTATLAPHSIGYESNEDLDNGFRPPGLIRLSDTTGPTPEYLQDFGKTVAPGTTTHRLTMYRAPSGALVFSTASIQWAWGLDVEHDGFDHAPADVRMQQATVNLLADMGAQPATLMAGLVAASASTDTKAPTVTFTSPANNSTAGNGAQVTLRGTATDTGGRVAAVEVSTDGGTSWHPATGTTSWTYPFYTNGVGTQVVRARAIDDSANIGVSVTRTINLTGPSSLFGARVPTNPAVNDTVAVTLGVKVVPQSSGTITGIRFYKGAGNTGTHTGTLWSATGTSLATGTFTGETASGWQTLTFAAPVTVSAGTTYIASYHAPSGHYAGDNWFFSTTDWRATPLSAPRSQTSGGNGVYRVGVGFPDQTFADTNYYVDVVFTTGGGGGSTAPTVVSVAPTPNATTVDRDAAASAVFSASMNPATIAFTLTDPSNVAVPGATSYTDSTKTATFTPSSPLGPGQRYTATVTGRDTAGTAMASPYSWSFTTTPYQNVSTLFASNATPATPSSGENSAITLGVKFVPATDGQLVGVRFAKGAGNTGTHTATLYSAGGTQLAKATFGSESASGWQTVLFAQPVTVTAGTTYIAAYYAPNGNYAVDRDFFASAWTNGPLSAPPGNNGVYVYGGDAFPTASYRSSNYWVDPLFVSSGTPPPPPPPPPPPANAVSLFADTDAPVVANWPDPSDIEVGVRFTSDVAGTVYGVRFYKGPQNTGTHTGSLWSSSGQLLATATFSGESDSGWQTVLFAQPVTIAANTVYVASYHAPVGRYAASLLGFALGYDRGPLHVAASGAAYRYGVTGYPSAPSSHNYWTDVVFGPSG
jgi:hypothetical protein